MAKVLVIELPDDAELEPAVHAVRVAIGRTVPDGTVCYVAIREDADRVLEVFKRDPMKWERALRQVAERARVEADAGAPGPMVAIYVEAEAEHLIAGHDGDEANCDACSDRAVGGRR